MGLTCPECKGSKVYQPLVGPAEPCRACGGCGELPAANDCTGELPAGVTITAIHTGDPSGLPNAGTVSGAMGGLSDVPRREDLSHLMHDVTSVRTPPGMREYYNSRGEHVFVPEGEPIPPYVSEPVSWSYDLVDGRRISSGATPYERMLIDLLAIVQHGRGQLRIDAARDGLILRYQYRNICGQRRVPWPPPDGAAVRTLITQLHNLVMDLHARPVQRDRLDLKDLHAAFSKCFGTPAEIVGGIDPDNPG